MLLEKRTFYYIVKKTSTRKNGGSNYKMAIYEIEDNKPIVVVSCHKFNSNGQQKSSECLTVLQQLHYLDDDVDFGDKVLNRLYEQGCWSYRMRHLIDIYELSIQ